MVIPGKQAYTRGNTMKEFKFDNLGKKGQAMALEGTPTLVITIVVVGIMIGLGFTIITSFQESQTVDSSAYNGTGQVISMFDNFVGLLPVLGTVLIAVVLIGAVVGLFFLLRNR